MRHIPISLPELVSAEDSLVFGQWLVDDGEDVLTGDRVAEVLTAGVLLYAVAPAEGAVIRSELRPGATLTVTSNLGVVVPTNKEFADD